ncbi:MAG TPA: ergothioneine biosynthesis glutamate--cysteine ligase EgtA [Catenuloplanes sp.]|jgi:glutamate--cysteine ligase
MGIQPPVALIRSDAVIRDRAEAEGYVASICFKTGPPALLGAELEFTVHHADDPTRPLESDVLAAALGAYAPPVLSPDSPAVSLPAGSQVTVEPGGQVEISTPPHPSLAALHTATETDRRHLIHLLARAGLRLGRSGLDPHRPPRRIVHAPRYAAMERSFDRRGPHGRVMMGSTAGLQVCLDAGEPERVAGRWAALHDVGPPLLAAFATSRRHAGHDTGWASARMAAWLGIDPARTAPVTGDDPARAGARYAVDAPLLCLRRPQECWDPPAAVSFADWADGALPSPPTAADLDYHLTTLFPPVRPRGYLEVRYLDAQADGEWIVPVALLTALLADDATVDAARDLAAPATGRWTAAARHGLADPAVAAAATALLDLACRSLDRTDLPGSTRDTVAESVTRRLEDRKGTR